MFRALCAHHQEIKTVLYSIWYRHTRRWPSRPLSTCAPDGHLQVWWYQTLYNFDLLMMSTTVFETCRWIWSNYKTRICALSWLITKKNLRKFHLLLTKKKRYSSELHYIHFSSTWASTWKRRPIKIVYHLLFLPSDLNVSPFSNVLDFTTPKRSERVGFTLLTGVKTNNSGK